MKRLLFLVPFFLLLSGSALSQNASYKVVFDLTSRDSLDQKAVMRWIKEITSANPNAELEIVMYGKGYEMVMPEKTTVPAELTDALTNPNVAFRVCRMALKNNKIDMTQIAPGVQTVPDGVYEIISKQHDGWGYIKVSH